MATLETKTALVLGASSGIGRATLLALAGRGMKVHGVARDEARLGRLVREAPGDVAALVGDATRAELVERWIAETDPDVIVVALGVRPRMATVDDQSWESFSAPWNTDVKVAFHVCQAAVRRPLRRGSTVVLVSSGAAIQGSPLSGGYAGAKRMQWLLAGYMQALSRKRDLGLRFVAVVPKQLVVGTEIADLASSAYAGESGISQAEFMARFGAPLVPEQVADAIVDIASADPYPEANAIAVTGRGMEALQ